MIDFFIRFCFILVFISVWFVLCIFKYKKWSNKRKKCTKHISVKVIDILEKKTARGGMIYKPIFLVEGVSDNSTIDSAYYSSLVSFEVGEYVELLVNPDNQNEFLYKDNPYNKGLIVDILCCCLPCIVLIGILITIL